MTADPSADLNHVLARIDAWYAAHVPGIHATLNPGATDAELDALETATGLTLPPGFRALYRWHDGQDWSVGGVFGMQFMPLSHVTFEWLGWQDIGAAHPEMNADIAATSHPAGAIAQAYTTPGWLGFLKDGGGNSVGVDLNPGPAGVAGQVITFGRDEHDKYVLADSLDAFVREYAARLNAGRVSVRHLQETDWEAWNVALHGAAGHAAESYVVLADLFPGFGASPTP